MKSHYLLACLLLGYFCFNNSSPSPAQTVPAKKNIAVLDLETRGGLSVSEVATLTDRLRSMLVETDAFNVVERGKMDAILKEVGFQQTGCTTTECAVEIGKILNVQEMVTGVLGKLGSIYTVDISIIDVETAKIKKSISKNHRGEIEGLIELLEPIVAQIAATSMIPSPPKPREVGSLEVSGEPMNAEVFVDDHSIGRSPVKIDNLSTGEHKINIIAGGYAPKESKVIIEREKKTSFKMKLIRLYTLKINSEPADAQVFINDQPAGKTPFVLSIPDGDRVNIRIRKENWEDWIENVSVSKDLNLTAKMDYTNRYKQELTEKTKPASPAGPKKSKTWLWIGGGIVAGGIAAAVFLKPTSSNPPGKLPGAESLAQFPHP